MSNAERIKFKRSIQVYTGKIVKVKSTCVIVEVSIPTQMKLNIDTNLTVVNFKNILEGPKIKPIRETKNRFQIKVGS